MPVDPASLCERQRRRGTALTHASLPQIGKSFGGEHHTTVIHSIPTIGNRRNQDRTFSNVIAGFVDLMREIRNLESPSWLAFERQRHRVLS